MSRTVRALLTPSLCTLLLTSPALADEPGDGDDPAVSHGSARWHGCWIGAAVGIWGGPPGMIGGCIGGAIVGNYTATAINSAADTAGASWDWLTGEDDDPEPLAPAAGEGE